MNIFHQERIFPEIPAYTRERIFGTEHAFGSIGMNEGELPGYIENGARIYRDLGHIEYCTPETRNPLEEIVYEKAGEIICASFAERIFKHNVARNIESTLPNEFTTFSAHENYFTKIDASQLKMVLPFLITRQIFAGAGWLKPNGEFEISQRASFIKEVSSYDTMDFRGIINERNEKLSNVPGWRRMHVIYGDANMCEMAGFLKIATFGLVLDLLEDELAPEILYESDNAVEDLHNTSKRTSDWFIQGNFGMGFDAIDVQRLYLNAAEGNYKGRDEMTDFTLERWGEIFLDRCESGIESLFGWSDWATLKLFVEEYAKKHGISITDNKIENINLQYFDTSRERGIFYGLQQQGKIERLITDEMIEGAVIAPPRDTRAYFRGNFIKRVKNTVRKEVNWDACKLFKGQTICYGLSLDDPLETYESELEDLDRVLKVLRMEGV